MFIKYQALPPQLKKNFAIFILMGSDPYLLNEAVIQIKQNWNPSPERDERIIYIESAQDWSQLQEEANSYSLFSEYVFLDARYDKTSVDATGKEFLKQYVQDVNRRCLILLRAPQTSLKQWQGFKDHEQVCIVQTSPLTNAAMQQWIASHLQQHHIRHDPQIPQLIQQYTAGNMVACAQVLEKLKLIYEPGSILNATLVQEQLVDQCQYALYELADACLVANVEKAIHLLRQAKQQRTEPTLILWILTQEIRQLIQLSHTRGTSFTQACSELKIWSQRVPLYQQALTRTRQFTHLLHKCKQLDEQIKSNLSQQSWNGLEQLVLALCGLQLQDICI